VGRRTIAVLHGQRRMRRRPGAGAGVGGGRGRGRRRIDLVLADDVAPGVATLPDEVDTVEQLVAAAVLVLIEEVPRADLLPVVRAGRQSVLLLQRSCVRDPIVEE